LRLVDAAMTRRLNCRGQKGEVRLDDRKFGIFSARIDFGMTEHSS
jgi:hypothetical protein